MSSVEDYMNTKMVMRDSKASVLELAKVMVDWGVSSVAITDEEDQNNNKKVIGILTERDIVKSIAKGVPPDGGGGITAGSIMSSPILSIRKGQPIEEAALLMIRNKVRHLLVEDPARNVVIGIISTTDLARYLKKRMKQVSVDREDEKEQQSSSSSQVLLSEAWELYF
ncbi:MAG: CBS domain-containing protein [Thermoproteota archaeon]|nr:CBS domain-containing protein [Thermoproteota archaeon]